MKWTYHDNGANLFFYTPDNKHTPFFHISYKNDFGPDFKKDAMKVVRALKAERRKPYER